MNPLEEKLFSESDVADIKKLKEAFDWLEELEMFSILQDAFDVFLECKRMSLEGLELFTSSQTWFQMRLHSKSGQTVRLKSNGSSFMSPAVKTMFFIGEFPVVLSSIASMLAAGCEVFLDDGSAKPSFAVPPFESIEELKLKLAVAGQTGK